MLKDVLSKISAVFNFPVGARHAVPARISVNLSKFSVILAAAKDLLRPVVAIAIIFIQLSACSSLSSSVSSIGDILSGESSGSATTGEVSATDAGDSSEGSSTNETELDSGDTTMLPITLPENSGTPSSIAYLTSDDVFAYAYDSESEIPITGSSSEAIGSTVVVSTNSDLALVNVKNPLLAKNKSGSPLLERGGWGSYFLKPAFAATTEEICAQEGVECCTTDESGNFECFLATTDSSVSKVYVSLMDSSGNLGSATEIDIASNFHYLGETPQDVVIAGDDIYTITNGVAVKTSYDSENERFEVAGSHEENYEDFTADGSKLSYDSENALMGVLNETSGVGLFTVEDGTVSDTGIVATAENATAYTVVKEVNDMLLYGTEHESTTEGRVEVANSALSVIEHDFSDSRSSMPSRIQYLSCTDASSADTCDFDSDGQPMTSTKVLAVDGMEYAALSQLAVAFVDGEGNIRVRFVSDDGDRSAERFGGTTSISISATSLKDIFVYHAQSSASDDSRLAVLDSENDRVLFGTFNVASQTESISTDNTVSVGDNPIAMKVHNNKLFVLNQGGQSVSVIRLFNADGSTPRRTPQVSATFDLTNLISGRTLSFTPKSLVISDGKLIIADQTKKALVVIDADDITEEIIDDESSESTSTESESSTSTDTETETTSGTETSSSTETETATESTTSSETATATSSSTETTTSSSSSSSSTSTSTSTRTSSGRGGRGG